MRPLDRPLQLGMIGAGFIGQLAHLMNYVEVRGCRVVALAELRPELRRRVGERYGIPRLYPTHSELIADKDVDAVIVVSSRAHTAPIVLDCLRAGKHVLSEKPMAGTAEQGQRLVDAAAERGLCYAVGYMKRYDEGVQLAKNLLDDALVSGELGHILFARAHCYMGDSYARADGHVVTDEKVEYPDEGWPTFPTFLPVDEQKPFAAFVNTYSHNTNLLRHLLGRVPEVEHASLSARDLSFRGQVAVLSFGSFVATLETGRASSRGWDEVTEIYFSDGRLTLRTPPALLRNVPAAVELYRAGSTQQITLPQCNWTWAFRRQAEAFVKDVVEGTTPLSSGADALVDLQLIEEMWRADMRRRRVL